MTIQWGDTAMLLVDDDDVFRARLARAMRDRGIAVFEATDYATGLEAARTLELDFAVIDLRMPGTKGGLELVREIDAIEDGPRSLVLTGYGSIANAVDAIHLGAVGYLPKPADADDILHAFERAAHPPLEAPRPDYDAAPSLARAEWEHINRVLTDCGGNITHAAQKLGIHRRSLQRKLQKYPPKT